MNLNINEGGLLSLLVSLTTNEGAAYLVWILCFLAVIAIGYLLGSVNSAILISKVLYRDDIRRYGSGNGGICGEHGGDPTSVEFCHKIGLDYVSCSPFRVPIARLAAAQAALSSK